MKTIVNINILRAAYLMQAKNDIRFYLNGIHFSKSRVESTNGHVAYMAKVVEDLPVWYRPEPVSKGVIVSITGKIPANKKIQWAAIEDDGNDSDKVIVRYFDEFSNQIDVGMGEKLDGKYPNIPKLIAGIRKQEPSIEAVGFNASYLGLVDKAFTRTNKYPQVKVEMFGAKNAAVFTHISLSQNKELMLIMPSRL